MGGRRYGFILVVGLGAACTPFAGPSGAAPTPDAGVTTTTDAGALTVADAGPEASKGRFCASSRAVFCADFDGESLFEGWSDPPTIDQGGSLTASERTTSAPTALLARLPRRTGVKTSASLSKQFDGPWHVVTVDFDVYLDAPAYVAGDSTSGLVCVVFYADGGTGEPGACISIGDGYAFLGNGGHTTVPFPTGGWAHVHIVENPNGTAEATVDDLKLPSATFDVSGGAPSFTNVVIGALGYNITGPALSATFDNVQIDLQ